ncbi:hypothetical protein O6P43_026999 [Quillaja saponaria]|uniref:Uncharacterized protein n=1 Tax=Quillaja saponaria TaxID=32244 RepID=A0AAD7L3W7_QUISA|nr:hypothetical protein O6P43_026999 [Quillaja saponaria]
MMKDCDVEKETLSDDDDIQPYGTWLRAAPKRMSVPVQPGQRWDTGGSTRRSMEVEDDEVATREKGGLGNGSWKKERR